MGSFNRDGVKRRLVEILAAELGAEWDVSYEWPGDDAGDRWLYFDAATPGDASTDTLSGPPGAKSLASDVFTIQGLLCTAGHITAEEAERAAGDAMRTVHDCLRRMRRLNDPSGAISDGADPTEYNATESVAVTRVDGPAATAPQMNDDGTLSGMCLFTITATSRL